MSTAIPTDAEVEQSCNTIRNLSYNQPIRPSYAAKIEAMIEESSRLMINEHSISKNATEIYRDYFSRKQHRTIYWVSEEFTHLILDAAYDFNDESSNNPLSSSIDVSTLNFTQSDGIIVFEKPIDLPVVNKDFDPTRSASILPIRSIGWMSGHFTGQNGDYDFTVLSGFHTKTGTLERCSHMPELFNLSEADIVKLQPLEPLALVTAFNYLIDQSNITHDETMTLPSLPAPITKGSKKKTKRIKQPDVRVITLNPRGTSKAVYERVVAENDGELVTLKRDYQHKWMVRGHWRNQPYRSLGEGVTKPIWIAPYIKGPDDKPLLTTPRVHAIRHI